MSNGSPTAFLSWALLASLVCGEPSSARTPRLTLVLSVPRVSFLSSLELRPPAMHQVERGTATRRVQATYDSAFFLFLLFISTFLFTSRLRSQYSYLGSTPLLIVFGVGIATLKFKEGAPRADPVWACNDGSSSPRAGFVALSEHEGALMTSLC